MLSFSFRMAARKPMSATKFLNHLFGKLLNLFKYQEALRSIGSLSKTCKELLVEFDQAGFPKDDLPA